MHWHISFQGPRAKIRLKSAKNCDFLIAPPGGQGYKTKVNPNLKWSNFYIWCIQFAPSAKKVMTDLRYLLSRGAKSVNRSQLFSRLTKLDVPNIKVTPFQIRVHFCFIPLATRGRYQKVAIFGAFGTYFRLWSLGN